MSDQRTPQPTMAEVLAEHEYDVVIEGVVRPACRCGWVAPSEWESTAVYDQHVAAALAAAGYGHVASELDERFAESDHKAAAYWRRSREMERRAEAAEAQVADLRRWKNEALPVIAGLQELGRALALPLGSRITGPEALEAVEALRAQIAAAYALADQWDTAGGLDTPRAHAAQLRAALRSDQ